MSLLLHDLTSWWIVYFYFRLWRIAGIWEKINAELRKVVREETEGCNPEPSAGIIDSQSVKAAETISQRGFDASKKINGIKRHIVTDTTGLLLKAVVHTADIQDRDGAMTVINSMKSQFPHLDLIRADGGYARQLANWAKTKIRIKVGSRQT